MCHLILHVMVSTKLFESLTVPADVPKRVGFSCVSRELRTDSDERPVFRSERANLTDESGTVDLPAPKPAASSTQ
jgi:hypothetical protein